MLILMRDHFLRRSLNLLDLTKMEQIMPFSLFLLQGVYSHQRVRTQTAHAESKCYIFYNRGLNYWVVISN